MHVLRTTSAVIALSVAGLAVVTAGVLTSGAATSARLTDTRLADRQLAHQQTATVAGPGFTPDIITLGTRPDDAPDTIADCQQAFSVACYDPAEIQQAYGTSGLYSQNITGKGTTIVVVDPYGSPTMWKDLVTFDSAYGLRNPPSLTIIKPAGHVPAYNRNNAEMVSWAGETTLDVEYSHAMAPGAKILLVETPTAGSYAAADFDKAETYVAKHHLGDVISQSFGTTEQAIGPKTDVNLFRGAFLDAEAAHITVLAAAGDTGATDPRASGNNLYTYPVTQWPATDPLVTAVGGTELTLNSAGTRTARDKVWNDTYNHAANQLQNSANGPSAIATGGGKSVLFSRPSYQDSVRQAVGSMRGIPDVSMNGACSSPVNVYEGFAGQQAGWYVVCGTSESTPLFAGIVALADQKAGHPLGLINPALYKLAAEHAQGVVPVSSGNNSVEFTQIKHKYWVHGYTARDGYSRAAGVGTIDAQYFVPELAKLG
ncbi:MAG TPA: S53 family peptidase [Streptosporangiaceae bacterium]